MPKRQAEGGGENCAGDGILKTKQKKKKKKRRPKSVIRHYLKNSLPFVPMIAPLILTVFIYAWLHTRITIVGQPLENLRAERRDLIKHNDSLRLRIEQLQAPARIESIAREKLGMISPEKWQVVALDEPIRPPEVILETDSEVREIAAPDRTSTLLFGFLKRRGILSSGSRTDTPDEAAPRSG